RTRRALHSFPTRRSSDLPVGRQESPQELKGRPRTIDRILVELQGLAEVLGGDKRIDESSAAPSSPNTPARSSARGGSASARRRRSEEHTSELQSLRHLVC